MKNSFRDELQTLVNTHCRENGSDTPDYVLAEYLTACLAAFDAATKCRDAHRAGCFHPRVGDSAAGRCLDCGQPVLEFVADSATAAAGSFGH